MTLIRGYVTYATGIAGPDRLTLHTYRAVRPGRYTLVPEPRDGPRLFTTWQRITIPEAELGRSTT